METPLNRVRTADPRKLTRAEVAQAVGVDASFYSRLESGESTASAELAAALAAYFGVAVEDIFKPARYTSEPQMAEA